MSDNFQQAASYLSSASAPSNTDTSTKLELYGLYKCVTASPGGPDTSRPSIFDPTGRAKWDAWKKASQQFKNVSQAERRYLEIAKLLGWTEGTVVTEGSSTEKLVGKGGGGGMGLSVSTLAGNTPKEGEDQSLHGLAVEDNLAALEQLFTGNEKVDVNSRDEFGYTALHLAADRGHYKVVKLLLQNGADCSLQDPDEMTADQLAETAGHEEILALLRETSAMDSK